MKKTITIHLNQVLFNIEEDAYEALQKYLESIKKYFAKTDDAEDIVSDIEASAADHFNKFIGKAKKVITLSDVEELISSMGTVKDISAEEESDEKEPEEANLPKKLFRNTQNKILGGVAAGLAAYFSIDPVIIRLVFVAAVLIPIFNGFGLLLYIILWFIMPEAKTTADRMAMKGEPVTLSNLEAAVSTKISSDPQSGLVQIIRKLTGFIGELATAAFKVLGKILWVLLALIGFCLIIGSALGIAGIVSLLVNLFANPHLISGGLAVADILPGYLYPMTLFSVAVIVFVPLIFLLQLGVSFLKRKSAFGLGSSLVLFFAWVIAISGIVALTINIAPRYQPQIQEFLNTNNSGLVFDGRSITPQSTTSKNYDYRNFNSINVSSAYQLTVKSGRQYQIEVFATPSQLERIRFNQTGNLLSIGYDNFKNNCLFCRDFSSVRIEVTTPVLNSLTASGATVVNLENLKTSQLTLALSGASKVTASGAVDQFKAGLSGASRLNTIKMATRMASVNSSGASITNLAVSSTLNASLSGASKLYYLGNPKITSKVTGASVLEKIDPQDFNLTIKNGVVIEPTVIPEIY